MKSVIKRCLMLRVAVSVMSITVHLGAMQDTGVVEAAAAAAADVNGGVEVEDNSSLHAAVQKGNVALVTQLLVNGADPNEKDEVGHTPLWYVGEQLKSLKSVVTKKQLAMVKVLYPRVTQVADSDGALLAACKSDSEDMRGVIRALCARARLEGRDLFGNAPLFTACRMGHVKIAQLLLDLKANIETRNMQDCTALHMAHVSTVPLLVNARANIDAQDRDGNTPLHRAVLFPKSEDTVRLLLQHGAKVDVPNKQGETPLIFVRRRHDKNVPNSKCSRIVQLLREHGAQDDESCVIL